MEQRQISLDAKVVVASDQVSTSLEDETVVLHLKDGVYYGLDPVGSRIWNLLQEPQTVKDVRDILLKEYNVEPQRCEQDLLNLLEKLANKGLIEIKGEASL